MTGLFQRNTGYYFGGCRRRLALVAVATAATLPAAAQDLYFAQPYANRLHQNPAFAGLLDDGSIEMMEAQLQIEHYWAGALRRAVIDGDVEGGSVMAGQSVGMVKRKEPVAEIIMELVDEAKAALSSRG